MHPRIVGRCLAAAFLLSAPALRAQDATEADHARVAGCYAVEPAAEAPWLVDVEPRVRLTMEPLEGAPGSGPQYRVRPAGAPRARVVYSFLSWSLFGEGRIVSIVWSSEEDQIGLVFVPEPERAHAELLGSTTFFTHEMMTTTDPVDVPVTAIDC